MNLEKLSKMTACVRIGGKGSMRRKKKIAPPSSSLHDEKKIQAEVKKHRVQMLTGIEEALIFRDDDSVLHFINPKVQGNSNANLLVITGNPFNRHVSMFDPMLSGATIASNPPPKPTDDDDDDIPDLTGVSFHNEEKLFAENSDAANDDVPDLVELDETEYAAGKTPLAYSIDEDPAIQEVGPQEVMQHVEDVDPKDRKFVELEANVREVTKEMASILMRERSSFGGGEKEMVEDEEEMQAEEAATDEVVVEEPVGEEAQTDVVKSTDEDVAEMEETISVKESEDGALVEETGKKELVEPTPTETTNQKETEMVEEIQDQLAEIQDQLAEPGEVIVETRKGAVEIMEEDLVETEESTPVVEADEENLVERVQTEGTCSKEIEKVLVEEIEDMVVEPGEVVIVEAQKDVVKNMNKDQVKTEESTPVVGIEEESLVEETVKEELVERIPTESAGQNEIREAVVEETEDLVGEREVGEALKDVIKNTDENPVGTEEHSLMEETEEETLVEETEEETLVEETVNEELIEQIPSDQKEDENVVELSEKEVEGVAQPPAASPVDVAQPEVRQDPSFARDSLVATAKEEPETNSANEDETDETEVTSLGVARVTGCASATSLDESELTDCCDSSAALNEVRLVIDEDSAVWTKCSEYNGKTTVMEETLESETSAEALEDSPEDAANAVEEVVKDTLKDQEVVPEKLAESVDLESTGRGVAALINYFDGSQV